jgi:glutamate-1-semialdehyde 2,1-aminomutase
MTAGRIAIEMFDKQAVANLNALTRTARKQLEEAIKIVDVPISITGTGSMFRLHFLEKAPASYREAYQSKETKEIMNDLIDYLFIEENIIMINTCSCMFATTLTQQNVDRLSEALLQGFKLIKPKLECLTKHI